MKIVLFKVSWLMKLKVCGLYPNVVGMKRVENSKWAVGYFSEYYTVFSFSYSRLKFRSVYLFIYLFIFSKEKQYNTVADPANRVRSSSSTIQWQIQLRWRGEGGGVRGVLLALPPFLTSVMSSSFYPKLRGDGLGPRGSLKGHQIFNTVMDKICIFLS